MKKKLSLTVTKLTCKRNAISIFNPISFKVSEGQMLIIKGKNGRGKTTLIHCLAGLLSYQGLVKWKGVEGKIGYIGHKFGLKEYETVYDFIKFWKAVYGSTVSIDEVVEYFSLFNVLFSPIAFLSFGQKKKLTFVRLYFFNNNVWLLDEPFSGMDDNNRELIFNMIESHISNKGMIILSTHEKGRISNIKNTKELVIE